MSETKFTPGPWSLEFDNVPYDGGFETLVINGENGGICMMDCAKDDMKANGRLIAAAPEMWKACQAALEYDAAIQRHAEKGQSWVADDELDALYDKWISAVQAAMAKATGGAK